MSDPYAGTFVEDIASESGSEQRGRCTKNGPGKQSRFKLTPFEQIQISTAPSYLVKGILPREGLAVIWGPPKCGKSFWTFDLLMHVALGWKYRGRPVKQGPVVYLALEGGGGFAARVEAWRRRRLNGHRERVPFYLISVPVNLIADHTELIQTIKKQLGKEKPAAIAIDTLNRALLGDENKSDDMAKFIRASDAIRIAFDCLVPIVHHCGVKGGRPRGHTSLSGADDVQIAVQRGDKDGLITVTVEHMKDGEPTPPFTCRLERVELGKDDDGEPMTSCVLVPVDDIAPAKGRKLSNANRFALSLLQRLIATEGEPPPPNSGLPDHILVYPAEKWRERFIESYPADKRDTKKKAYLRAVLDLQEAEFIEVWREFVWQRDNGTKRDK